ncbi:hypothetical protein L1987_02144 [Smallanthus sonchifolius]|uniref:Uncharacterized protein n=1 Tax=Smallanthus sonchifolius TaxID=185202 RepID=A0ACB9K781_9ASTR|nr:hypothetical protein L1987_02144 [Smallanthus sonchifolius]
MSNILKYNPNIEDNIPSFVRINVPFSCDCINGWIQRFNSYDRNGIPNSGNINVMVNCSCGDSSISKDYGLFVTYPLRPGETLDSISSAANLSSDLIRSYNPDINFSQGSSLIYLPGRG